MADTAPAIQRARRCLAEGRGVLAGDLAALLDRVDQLEREVADTAGLRRRAAADLEAAEQAERLFPGLGHRAQARRMHTLAIAEGRAVVSERRLAERIKWGRIRNKHGRQNVRASSDAG